MNKLMVFGTYIVTHVGFAALGVNTVSAICFSLVVTTFMIVVNMIAENLFETLESIKKTQS